MGKQGSDSKAGSLAQAFQHDLPHEINRSFLSSEELKLLCSLTNKHLNTTDRLAPGSSSILQSIIHMLLNLTLQEQDMPQVVSPQWAKGIQK